MSDRPLISVLIPCWNRADTIERCVRSALDNGYEKLQVIISDNASTDGTWELVQRLGANDSRVVAIRQSYNRGPLPNWRACLDRARGELVHWLWSDDWIHPHFYGGLVDGMNLCNAQMACSALVVVEAETGRTTDRFRWPWRCWSGRRAFSLAVRSRFMPSPAAWLLPAESVRVQMKKSIPRFGQLDCMRRAIGPDELMIFAALHSAERVYASSKPRVTFTAHPGSISVSQGRLLSAHYAWARLTWLRQGGCSIGLCGWVRAGATLIRRHPRVGLAEMLVRHFPRGG